MRAVIYARVSTEEQAKHNFSLESQVDLARKWIIEHKFELACEPFIDAGESAKTMNRKALARLLEYCRTHKDKVDAVLIYKIDRIARNMADHVAIRSLLSQYGVRIYSVTEPIGGDNSTSKLLENVMASFAQFDNDAKAERTKDGIRKRVSKGEISWVAPIGYCNVMKPGGYKTIVPDTERAPIVKKLFEEYAKGIYKESEITRMANNIGFTTPKGNKIRQQVIHKMLRSRIYTGVFLCRGQEMQGAFEPIITTELFERVQFYIRNKTGRTTNHPKRMLNPDFPLRVTARCVCGGKFTGSWSRGHGGRYAYYHCARCHKRSVKKEIFESQFMELLQKLAPKKEEMAMFRATVIDYWQNKHNELNTDIATIDRNIQKVEEEKVKVVDLTKQGIFDAETAKEELNRIKEKITVLKLSRNELQIEEFDVEACVNYCLYFMVNVAKLWYEIKLSDKIKFQEMVFPNGISYDYSAFGTTKTADVYELKQLITTKNSTMVPLKGLNWNHIMRNIREFSELLKIALPELGINPDFSAISA